MPCTPRSCWPGPRIPRGSPSSSPGILRARWSGSRRARPRTACPPTMPISSRATTSGRCSKSGSRPAHPSPKPRSQAARRSHRADEGPRPPDANQSRRPAVPRYITLDHLHNNLSISDDQLQIHRTAVSKLLNSLSREREITRPEAIDVGSEVILHFDLRRTVGSRTSGSKPRRHIPTVSCTCRTGSCWKSRRTSPVWRRPGWPTCGATGSWPRCRPALYDRLLRLPESLKDLEKTLGVYLPRNFEQARLKRGELITSDVSRHNQLV